MATMSSRIERMKNNHGSEIEEIEKRLRVLRLRARFAAARDRSIKMADRETSSSDHLSERYKSRQLHDHDSRPSSNRQSRPLGSRGGILDTGLCALPYHGFAERLFGSESEDEEYMFSDDENNVFEEDRSDEDDEIMSHEKPPSSSRQDTRVPQTERRYIAPPSLQATHPEFAHTKQKTIKEQHPAFLTVTRDASTASSVLAREQAFAPTTISQSRSMKTKPQEHSSPSIRTSDTKRTWLNRLKCQSHADKDDLWIPKDVPHILQEYGNDHWNVYDHRKVDGPNVLRNKSWNQDDSSTIATYPSIDLKQHSASKHVSQTREASQTPSNAYQPKLSLNGRSFENATPISGSRIKANRSISTGRTRSVQSSSGSRSHVSTTPNRGMQRVGTGQSRKSATGSNCRSTPKKISKPMSLDLRLSASDDSTDPYEAVQYFQTGYRTGTGAITSSWW